MGGFSYASWGRRVAVGCAVLGCALSAPRSAAACSIAQPAPALMGYPSDGEVDVPVEVVPFYAMSAAQISDPSSTTFLLEREGGGSVAIAADSTYNDQLQLTPEHELEPHTKYTLKVAPGQAPTDAGAGPQALELTFTTGTAEQTPLAPDAFISHYQFAPDQLRTSCSPWQAATCVALSDGATVVESEIDEFGQEVDATIHTGSFFTNISGVAQGTSNHCVRLRTRAPSGKLSDPVDLCREDGQLYTLKGSENIACSAQGLTQDGELVATRLHALGANPESTDVESTPQNTSKGCSLSGAPNQGLQGSAAGLVALLLMARRRRS